MKDFWGWENHQPVIDILEYHDSLLTKDSRYQSHALGKDVESSKEAKWKDTILKKSCPQWKNRVNACAEDE